MNQREKRLKVKKSLYRYQWIKKDIELAQQEIEELNTKLYEAKGQIISDMPRGGQGKDTTDRIGMKQEAEKRLADYIARAEEIRTELETVFDQVPDDKLRLVLRSIYIYGNSLYTASKTLGYNYRYMLGLHQQAIDLMIELNLYI